VKVEALMAPPPPLTSLSIPQYLIYISFFTFMSIKKNSITNKKTIQQKLCKETLKLMLDIKIV